MTQKTKFKRQFNKTYKGNPGVPNNMPSMTVPDMNLTLKELLHNHTRGIASDVHNYDPQYFEDEIPTITDLTDLDELKKQNSAKQKELQKKAAQEIEAAKYQRNHKEASKEKTDEEPIQKTVDTKSDKVLPDTKTDVKKH